MIKKISLKNWRSHSDTELVFSDGTNALIGLMGGGKSSVLSGICFGLFGTFPELQSRKVKLEDVIMKKPKEQKQAEISVVFDLGDGIDWTVKRVISKGKSTEAELRKNGQIVEAQVQKVNEDVERLLKINYDLFTRAIYSEQNQIDMFLTIPKGQRMKKIDEILAIDRFEKARTSTKTLGGRVRLSADEKKTIIQELEKDSAVQMLSGLKSSIETLRKEKERIEQQLKTAKNRRADLERGIDEVRRREKERREIEDGMKSFTALIEAVEEEIDKLKEDLMDFVEKTDEEIGEGFQEKKKELEGLEREVEDENRKLLSLKEMLGNKQGKLAGMEEKIPETRKKIKEKEELEKILKRGGVKKVLGEIEKKRGELEKSAAAVQAGIERIAEAEEGLREIKRVESICPICDNPLGDKKKENIIERKEKLISKLKLDVEHGGDRAEKLRVEIKDLEKELKEVENIEFKLSQLETVGAELKFLVDAVKQFKLDIQQINTEVKMAEKAQGLFKGRYETLRNEYDNIKRVLEKRAELSGRVKRRKEIETNIIGLQEKSQRLGPLGSLSAESMERELQTAIGFESAASVRIETLGDNIKEKETILVETEKKMETIEKIRAESIKMETIAEQLVLLESSLLATQEQLRRYFVSAVNQAMGLVWQNLYPYGDFKSCRLGIEEGDYILQLQDSTGWIPVDGVASGGERSIAALALRIAFALVLAPQLRWLILDEPTHNLDEKATQELAAVLRDRISEFVEQVFLVTHNPEMENAVSGYLYRFERAKEKDEPSRVTMISGPQLT
ncbi:MAG: SMC family ATPase [Candidatus Aenigmarchaeota archaeon]|nr:SMC family ATPase [Candidatus Aenigmarchaeota archaeon]